MSPMGKRCPVCRTWFETSIGGELFCPHELDVYHRDVMMTWGLGG